jgi:undecaprenyl pyrophosphate synthase
MLLLRTLFKRRKSRPAGLMHVLVCGGTAVQWLDTTTREWERLSAELSACARGVGMRWITICPYDGNFNSSDITLICQRIAIVTGGTIDGANVTHLDRDGFTISFNVCADGRQRFIDAANTLRGNRVNEETLSAMLHQPAQFDPDLIVVFGPQTKIPRSLMWELGYSELVFVEKSWRKFEAVDVSQAISDFTMRERRFGDIDV